MTIGASVEPLHGIPQGPFRCQGCGRQKWWLPMGAQRLLRRGLFLTLVTNGGRPMRWERHVCATIPAPKRSTDYRLGYKNGWRAGRIPA